MMLSSTKLIHENDAIKIMKKLLKFYSKNLSEYVITIGLCDCLNKTGPHRPTTSRYGHVEVGVALLEEVCD